VCQGFHREVFSHWREGNFRPPVKGEVNGEEAFSKVRGRVLGPEGREGEEGLRESGCGRVGVRGGAGESESG